jgi:ankyrin repeat protein
MTKHEPGCKSLEEQAHHRALNEAFMRACSTGILRLVKTMLEERGADANYVSADQLTPLIAASGGGHVPVVEALIAAGSEVEYARREDGYTALLVACDRGHVDIVRVLLRAGADPNQAFTNEYAEGPLIEASARGFVQIVDELISAGANVNYAKPNDGFTSLMCAAGQGFVDVVRSLLAAGADPRTARHSGHTALDAALQFNHPAIATLLKAKIAELSGST